MLCSCLVGWQRILFNKYLTAVTFQECLPWHHNRRQLTCWERWTFRWWPAQTGPWSWGSEIQTPHSLCSGTLGYPQYTAWSVSVERHRQGLLCVCMCVFACVCEQDVIWAAVTWFDGAQIWWGNSCRTLALFPPCVQSNYFCTLLGLPNITVFDSREYEEHIEI